MENKIDFWLSYSFIDFIPIEPEVYLRLFERANQAMWPFSLILTFLLVVFVLLQLKQPTVLATQKKIGFLLSASWLLVGLYFFGKLFNELNWSGFYFAVIFCAQGLLLQVFYTFSNAKIANKRLLCFNFALVLLALTVYGFMEWYSFNNKQLVGKLFGIAPNPTCLVTIGLILSTSIPRWWVLVIPVFWGMISALIGLAFGFYDGIVLVVFSLLFYLNRRQLLALNRPLTH